MQGRTWFCTLCFLCLWACTTVLAFSQSPAAPPVPVNDLQHRYLVLDTSWPLKRERFYPGQVFMFKLKDEPGWHRGRIQWVYPKSIYVLDANIPLSDIQKVRIQRNGYWQNFGSLTSASLVGGGILFIILGGLNELRVQTDPEYEGDGGKYLAIAGAGALVTGTGLRLINKRTYKIGRRHLLRTI